MRPEPVMITRLGPQPAAGIFALSSGSVGGSRRDAAAKEPKPHSGNRTRLRCLKLRWLCHTPCMGSDRKTIICIIDGPTVCRRRCQVGISCDNRSIKTVTVARRNMPQQRSASESRRFTARSQSWFLRIVLRQSVARPHVNRTSAAGRGKNLTAK